jgi:hypothetical protein
VYVGRETRCPSCGKDGGPWRYATSPYDHDNNELTHNFTCLVCKALISITVRYSDEHQMHVLNRVRVIPDERQV